MENQSINKKSYLTYQYFDFPNVDITPRIDFLKQVVLFAKMDASSSSSLKEKVEEGLQKNKIYYIYSTYNVPSLKSLGGVEEIFHNEVASIYEVKK